MKKNIKNYVIIILLIMVALGATLFFMKNSKNNKMNIKIDGEELSLNNDLVKNLHKFTEDILTCHNADKPSGQDFYRINKVTLDDLSDGDKLVSIFYRDKSLEYEYDDSKDNYIDSHQNIVISREKYYDKDKISLYGKKMFGENFNINFSEGKKYADCMCEELSFENGSIVVLDKLKSCSGGVIHFSQRKMIKAVKKDDYINIYDKYFFINTSDSKEHPAGIYDTSEMKNLLKKFGDNEYGFDVTFEEYEDLAKVFKHTFKKDTDGNYHWISSEMVK